MKSYGLYESASVKVSDEVFSDAEIPRSLDLSTFRFKSSKLRSKLLECFCVWTTLYRLHVRIENEKLEVPHQKR